MPLPEYHRVQLDELTVSLEEQRKKDKEEEVPWITVYKYKPTRGAIMWTGMLGWCAGFICGVMMFGFLQMITA